MLVKGRQVINIEQERGSFEKFEHSRMFLSQGFNQMSDVTPRRIAPTKPVNHNESFFYDLLQKLILSNAVEMALFLHNLVIMEKHRVSVSRQDKKNHTKTFTNTMPRY